MTKRKSGQQVFSDLVDAKTRTPTPAPQGAPETADHNVDDNKMINKDLIRELKHHAQEWSGRIVGDRLTEAAEALATSDARIATARNEALEEAALEAYVLLLADIHTPKHPKDIRDAIRALKTPTVAGIKIATDASLPENVIEARHSDGRVDRFTIKTEQGDG